MSHEHSQGQHDPALAQRVVCPHCWHVFDVTELLAVAQHDSLRRDDVLGDHEFQRFLPTRFDPQGFPLDAKNMPCPDLACPRCHLIIPRSLTRKRPCFLSIIGVPASGKSYLLTAMVSRLKRIMGRFGYAFTAPDPKANLMLTEYEQTLFETADLDTPVKLGKTQLQGALYDKITLNQQPVWLPRPFMFSLVPREDHAFYEDRGDNLEQTLILYDNAGEHFLPAVDDAQNPGTRHLAHAAGLFFVFDPTKSSEFRRVIESDDPQMNGSVIHDQESVLSEAFQRIQRYAPAAHSRRIARPLIVIVSKCDIWRHLIRIPMPEHPWREIGESDLYGLDLDAIDSVSFAVRDMLLQHYPHLVQTAETCTNWVRYIPTSALGCSPVRMEQPQAAPPDLSAPDQGPPDEQMARAQREIAGLAVRPRDINPFWATVPMLYMLRQLRMVPGLRCRKRPPSLPAATDCRLVRGVLSLTVPGTGEKLRVPRSYLGRRLTCPRSGRQFWVPSPEELQQDAT